MPLHQAKFSLVEVDLALIVPALNEEVRVI